MAKKKKQQSEETAFNPDKAGRAEFITKANEMIGDAVAHENGGFYLVNIKGDEAGCLGYKMNKSSFLNVVLQSSLSVISGDEDNCLALKGMMDKFFEDQLEEIRGEKE